MHIKPEVIFLLRTIANGTLDAFTPMLDTDGIPINASDGGIIYADGKYHWYGLRLRPLSFASGGKGGQVTDTGVVMYASDDLTSWTYEGVILSCSAENHLLRAPMRFERPKILYNRRTGKYVLWCHYVASPGDHGFTEGTAEAGIAVCDTVNGQYKFLCTCRPIDSKGLVRDCTLFQDDDGSAYFIYDRQVSTEFHPVLHPFERCLHIVRLSEDYLSPTDEFLRVDAADAREAPCLIKHNGKYYMITSGLTGWAYNQAKYFMADSIMGHWRDMGDPCVGDDEHTTFRSQGTFIFTTQKHTPIFMCERHNTADFSRCGHIWLPLRFNPDDTLEIRYTTAFDVEI